MKKDKTEKSTATASSKRKRSLKYQALLELCIALALIVVINVVSNLVFSRIDLTKEKRFTLSQNSKDLAGKLDDIVYVKVYLEGEMNPGFKRLQNATKEMLDEYRVASNGNFEYEFINPLEGKSPQEKQTIIGELRNAGLTTLDMSENQDGKLVQSIIVPGAQLYYKTTQMYGLNLIQTPQQILTPQVLNESVEKLEYGISSILKQMLAQKRKRVAFIEGHGELNNAQTYDAAMELDANYVVERFNLNFGDTVNFFKQFEKDLQNVPVDSLGEKLIQAVSDRLRSYDAIIIAKPTERYSEEEKYHIDQYIMNGGKVIWMIDPLLASLDSINKYIPSPILTANYDLNLEDQLFYYGARINPDLVQDMQCKTLPLGRDRAEFPWVYDVLASATEQHPIVNNLKSVWFRFASSIDTVGKKKGIHRQVLLNSSPNSRALSAPVELSFRTAISPPDPRLLNKPFRILALLEEGEFESLYAGRIINKFDPAFRFKAKSVATKQIFISDGDLIRSHVRENGEVLPLGYDFYQHKQYANKTFFMNCMDYLLDETELIDIRNKKFELRPLNKDEITKSRSFWVGLNLSVPVALILIFGVANALIRRRKYKR